MNLDDLNDLEPARLPFPVTRSSGDAPALEGDTAPHIVGRFSTFGDAYEIDSHIEGRFLESIKPGAFRKTIAESRDQMKVLYDHGQDPTLGNMILGKIESLSEDSRGPAYDVAAFDGIPPLLLNGLRAGAYGSSFRFSVEKDVWDYNPERSASNPEGLPERTITEARVFEFGPVTFPANPAATAGVRSTTDAFYQRSRDPEAFETLLRSAQVARAPRGRALSKLSKRSLEDLAAYLLADPAALSAAIAKLAKGEPLLAQEAELLEAAIEHLEPPDADEDDMQMNARPQTGSGRIAEPPPTTPAPSNVTHNLEPVRSDTPPVQPEPTVENRTVTEYQHPDERNARIVELEAVIKRTASEETGVMSTAVQQQWDKDTSELSDLRAAKAAYEKRMRQVSDLAVDERHQDIGAPTIIREMPTKDIYDVASIRQSTRSRDEYDAKIRDHAMRSIDAAKISKAAGDLNPLVELLDRSNASDLAERVLVSGSPAYRRFFTKLLNGQENLATQEERSAAALAVTGTTTTGGYAVPYVFDPTVIRIGATTPQNPFRQACRTVTLTNGNNWRAVTANATTAVYGTEAQPSVESGPTFAQPTYTVQTAQSFVTLSIETMEDRPDITAELTENFAEAKNTLEENKFAVGAGTTVYPMGMFTDTAYTNQDTATNDVTALLDFSVVEGVMPLRYRVNAAWFMARSTIRQLQILDTSYRYFSGAQIQFPGQGLLQVGSTGGGNTGLRLLGYPIWEVPSAVSTLTTDGAIIAVLCDPQTYIIVDRIGMNVEVIPNMTNGATPSFPTLQRGVLAYWRNTAKPHTAASGVSLSVQ